MVRRDSAMDFYTMVLRKSGTYWVVLCFENRLVVKKKTKKGAVKKLQEAIDSFQEAYRTEGDIYSAPLSIKELHEFLTVEGKEPASETYELMAVHA